MSNEYNKPVIFRELKDGTEFMLLLHDIVFVKVRPQKRDERTVNAISTSKIFNTFVHEVEMAYIKEPSSD